MGICSKTLFMAFYPAVQIPHVNKPWGMLPVLYDGQLTILNQLS